jgi:hypothetical protein
MNITEVELRKLTFAVQATIAREYAFEGSTVLHARVDFLTGNNGAGPARPRARQDHRHAAC